MATTYPDRRELNDDEARGWWQCLYRVCPRHGPIIHAGVADERATRCHLCGRTLAADPRGPHRHLVLRPHQQAHDALGNPTWSNQ